MAAGKRMFVILALFGMVLSFVAGLFTANYTVNYGAVDFVAGMPDKKVTLNRDVGFSDGKGNKQMLPEGAVLTWEGAQGGEYYLSVRYVLRNGSLFEVVENDNTYDFMQEEQ